MTRLGLPRPRCYAMPRVITCTQWVSGMAQRPPSQYDYEAERRSHERHLAYIYGLRLGPLVLSAIAMCLGAAMIVRGPPKVLITVIGPFRLRMPPGIVFATIGLVIALLVIMIASG
jgi:hypothetical protein